MCYSPRRCLWATHNTHGINLFHSPQPIYRSSESGKNEATADVITPQFESVKEVGNFFDADIGIDPMVQATGVKPRPNEQRHRFRECRLAVLGKI